MARSTIIRVKNNTGTTIAEGKAVYFTGHDDSGDEPASTVDISSNDDFSKMPAIGLTLQDIENDAIGVVRTNGIIGNLDTSGQSPNDPVFIGTNGNIIFEDPLDDDTFSQQIGTVAKVGLDDGQVFVFPLEVREQIEHDDLIDVREDQHHVRLHAETHRQGGIDELHHNDLRGRTDSNAHNQYVLTNGNRDINGNQTVNGTLSATTVSATTLGASTATVTNDITSTSGYLSGNEGLRVARTSAPSSPADGQIIYRTDVDTIAFYDSGRGAWLGELDWDGAGKNGVVVAGSAEYLRRFNGMTMSATAGVLIPYNIRIVGVSMVWENPVNPPGSNSQIRFKRNGATIGTHLFSGGTQTSNMSLNHAFSANGILAWELLINGVAATNDIDQVQLKCWYRRQL